MAQRVNVILVDDLDGSEASGSVAFALDGRDYEIDLSDENAARLRDALAAYVASARRTGGAQRTTAPAVKREDTTAIRQWARENGHPVSDRGRIPSHIIEGYSNRSAAPAASPAQADPAPAAKSVPVEPTSIDSGRPLVANPFALDEAAS